MAQTCLLLNKKLCARRKSIERTCSDDQIRLVYGYDWKTHSDNYALIFEQISNVLEKLKKQQPFRFLFTPLHGKDGSIYCDICRQIHSADIAIFDISTHSPNVALELGIAIGAGKYVFILRSLHYKKPSSSLSDLNGILEYRFSRKSGKLKFQADFQRSLSTKLRHVVNGYLDRRVATSNNSKHALEAR